MKDIAVAIVNFGTSRHSKHSVHKWPKLGNITIDIVT